MNLPSLPLDLKARILVGTYAGCRPSPAASGYILADCVVLYTLEVLNYRLTLALVPILPIFQIVLGVEYNKTDEPIRFGMFGFILMAILRMVIL